jgi:hypothetical protein
MITNFPTGENSKKEYNKSALELSSSHRAFQKQKYIGTANQNAEASNYRTGSTRCPLLRILC